MVGALQIETFSPTKVVLVNQFWLHLFFLSFIGEISHCQIFTKKNYRIIYISNKFGSFVPFSLNLKWKLTNFLMSRVGAASF